MSRATAVWTDSHFLIRPPIPGVDKLLTFYRKTQERDRGTIKIVSEKEECFTILHDDYGPYLFTHQGFYDRIYHYYVSQGYEVDVVDQRLPFPSPRLDLMHGFRFNQEEVLTTVLNANRSGGLSAVTRYGKSRLILNTMRAYPNLQTVLAAPGANLIKQTVDDLRELLPGRDIRELSGSRKKSSPDITVCSMDSLHKADHNGTRLLLIDEPHAIGTFDRSVNIAKFTQARRIGFGASWSGRSDGSDMLLEALMGPVLRDVTYTEGVEVGAICPIRVYMVDMPFRPTKYKQRESVLRHMLYENPAFAQIVGNITNHIIPKDWQSIIFIDRENQGRFLQSYLDGDVPLAMDKVFENTSDRDKMLREMKNATHKRCLATSIYATGLTFSNLRVMMNLSSVGGSITSIQKPGRLAEIREGKKRGYVIDFMFREVDDGVYKNKSENTLCRASKGRLREYKRIKYEVVNVPLVRSQETGLWYPDPKILVFD